jgi:hypothetical protein
MLCQSSWEPRVLPTNKYYFQNQALFTGYSGGPCLPFPSAQSALEGLNFITATHPVSGQGFLTSRKPLPQGPHGDSQQFPVPCRYREPCIGEVPAKRGASVSQEPYPDTPCQISKAPQPRQVIVSLPLPFSTRSWHDRVTGVPVLQCPHHRQKRKRSVAFMSQSSQGHGVPGRYPPAITGRPARHW